MLHKALLRVAGILGGGITGLASLQSKQVGEFAGLAKIPPSSMLSLSDLGQVRVNCMSAFFRNVLGQ